MDGDKKLFIAMGALCHAVRALWYNLDLNESGAEVYELFMMYVLKKGWKIAQETIN